jgi:hypothetical protein
VTTAYRNLIRQVITHQACEMMMSGTPEALTLRIEASGPWVLGINGTENRVKVTRLVRFRDPGKVPIKPTSRPHLSEKTAGWDLSFLEVCDYRR